MTTQSRKNETLQHQRRRLFKMKEEKKTIRCGCEQLGAAVEEGIGVRAQNRNSISANKKSAAAQFYFRRHAGIGFLFASGAESGGAKGQNRSEIREFALIIDASARTAAGSR